MRPIGPRSWRRSRANALGLERQLLETQGKTNAIRKLELAGLDASNRALQRQIWALEDAAAAADKAAQREADRAAKLEAIASERAGLERQLLEAQGKTNAIRKLELAGLDASNRALQRQIWALEDQKAATEAAAQAAQDAAAKQQAIADERAGLERQMLELRGDTAAIRKLELAALDKSNRALQRQLYAMQDAKAAAEAADQLRQAWKSVSDSLLDEVARIRGVNTGGDSFASLTAKFNAATKAARAGDQVAAGTLPELSKSLIDAAAMVATSQQEVDRVSGQTAASLERTAALIDAMTASNAAAQAAGVSPVDEQSWWQSFAAAQSATTTAANDDAAETKKVKAELVGLRADLRTSQAALASAVNKIARFTDNVTSQSGGDAIATVAAA